MPLSSYFKKAEKYHSSSQRSEILQEERGLNGLWTTGRSDTPLAVSLLCAHHKMPLMHMQPISQAAYKACVNLGVKEVAYVDRVVLTER